MIWKKQSTSYSHTFMPNYPDELITRGRTANQNFADTESLFIRFKEVDGDEVAVDGLRCPNQSCNRGTICTNPEWVLLAEPPAHSDRFKHWGYGYVQVRDIPGPLESPGGVVAEFKPFHDPTKYNYSHTEIQAYKSGRRTNNLNDEVKLQFRIDLSHSIVILKNPNQVG